MEEHPPLPVDPGEEVAEVPALERQPLHPPVLQVLREVLVESRYQMFHDDPPVESVQQEDPPPSGAST